jgi:hypothetical protein
MRFGESPYPKPAAGAQADRARQNGGISMHASLSTAASESRRPAVDKGKSKDERQAEEENRADTASKPGGFHNDPDDPKNPNQVRERHLKKIKP